MSLAEIKPLLVQCPPMLAQYNGGHGERCCPGGSDFRVVGCWFTGACGALGFKGKFKGCKAKRFRV